jgi:hypothetical protein
MMTNPAVPVEPGRDLLIPEHLEALRRESIPNGAQALPVFARIGKEDICHVAPRGTCIDDERLPDREVKLNNIFPKAGLRGLGFRDGAAAVRCKGEPNWPLRQEGYCERHDQQDGHAGGAGAL